MINNPIEPEDHTLDQSGNNPSGSTLGHTYDLDIPDTLNSSDPEPNETPAQPGQQPSPEVQVPRENEASNPEQSDASYPQQSEVNAPRENDASSPDEEQTSIPGT